jgi:hypothetical protein
MPSGIKVRLTTGLTSFNKGLIPGIEGHTVGRADTCKSASDQFIGVQFQDIGTFEIRWQSLEITDTDYLAQESKRKEKELETLKFAKNVKRIFGPKGGFKQLHYECVNANGQRSVIATSDPAEAERLLKFFEEHGIAVSETHQKPTMRQDR